MPELILIASISLTGINAVLLVLAKRMIFDKTYDVYRATVRRAIRAEQYAGMAKSYLHQIQQQSTQDGTVDMSLPMTLDPEGRTGEMMQKVGAA